MKLYHTFRRILKFNFPINNLIGHSDYDEDYILDKSKLKNEKNIRKPEEGTPFHRYYPVENHPLKQKEYVENYEHVRTAESNGVNHQNITNLFENFGKKFQEHRFMVSPTVLCIIICITIIVTCCCTLWLRNRIMGCIKSCCPTKKKREYDSLDSEDQKKDKKLQFEKIKQRYSPLATTRAKSLSKDYTPMESTTNVVYNIEKIPPSPSSPPLPPPSPPPLEQILETPPSTSCCGVCKSKKVQRHRNK